MRVQLHQLELVYPPVSNQEAEWIKDDPEVREQISKSNLYFIGQKPEATFAYTPDTETKLKSEFKLHFSYQMGSVSDPVEIDVATMLQFYNLDPETGVEFEMGDKVIKIWEVLDGGVQGALIDWFTTDKILFDKSRGKPFIEKFERYRDFYSYFLHYVGISKNESSLERLLIKPHDKRLRILSNEYPIKTGARLTDEVVLFFFRIKSMEVKQYLKEDDFEKFGDTELEDYNRIIAEAEKAFVKVMDTKYNEIKFKNYPKYMDGLYNSPIERYSFSIDEDVRFITDSNIIVSNRRKFLPQTAESDFIAISKDVVELIKVNP